jgi:hypothetical protein
MYFDRNSNGNKDGKILEGNKYVLRKEFFRTCNVLPFSCTHLALWRGKEQGKRPKVHAKQKGSKNFFSLV